MENTENSGKFFWIFGKFEKEVLHWCILYVISKIQLDWFKIVGETRKQTFRTIFQEKNHNAALRRSHKQCVVIPDFRAPKITLGPLKKIKKKIFLTPLNLFYNIHYVVSYVAWAKKLPKWALLFWRKIILILIKIKSNSEIGINKNFEISFDVIKHYLV